MRPDDQESELQFLRNENIHLKALLDSHGIPWEPTRPDFAASKLERFAPSTGLSTEEKVALFRKLFAGREDVFALRWESKKGKSGYSPACGNEWKPGICEKPKIKCADCPNRRLLPLTDEVIYKHLSGVHTVGVYPLLSGDLCRFLAVDFDKQQWKDDALSFMETCTDLDIPAAMEISRSGNGAHVWILFRHPVPAKEARRLGAALISRTCERKRQLELDSYDRFFPNQDVMPQGGFGNLIAMPLQKIPRESGRSIFVDDELRPYPDQWSFLSSLRTLTIDELEDAVRRASGGHHPLDIPIVSPNMDDSEDEDAPWITPKPKSEKIPGPMPESLDIVLANQIFIEKELLPQPLMNRIIRLAAFANPEFYKAQAMRLPVWNKPRIIGCAENHPKHIGLPRGCLDELKDLLDRQSIRIGIQEERSEGSPIEADFTGTLRTDQKKAVDEILKHDIGVLSAPTAFGKTVVASALIAERKVSTLILAHRTELLRQWQERLTSFLEIPEGPPGAYGGGKKKLRGHVDIAVMQSLIRRDDLAELMEGYGQVLVDECHHLSAFSFEAILKQAKARYVLGLTATPRRRDGHHPIIFMQCGPIRHHVRRSSTAPTVMEVRPRYLNAPAIPSEAKIQEIFRLITRDDKRNEQIAEDIKSALNEGRKILVLTERTDHLEGLRELLEDFSERLFVLHGRLSKKQRRIVLEELESLDDTAPRIILATGRLIGEGFDHPPLDTLFLAMPISWKGTLQQYAGRLHRDHADKGDVRIYDYVEADNLQLNRMWEKRLRGYRAMGYRILS